MGGTDAPHITVTLCCEKVVPLNIRHSAYRRLPALLLDTNLKGGVNYNDTDRLKHALEEDSSPDAVSFSKCQS
jgi:hypothetical protein